MMRWFTLDRDSPLPLGRQIYAEISSRVLGGELEAGDRLPSTRETAAELGISRNVVIEAYEQLIVEGYLIGVSGAGTYVAEGSRLDVGGGHRGGRGMKKAGGIPVSGLEGSGAASARDSREGVIDFRLGQPALDLVPLRAWARLEYEELVRLPPDVMCGAPPGGRVELREALQEYLWRRRGIECEPDQVVITSGAVQGFSLIAKLLLAPGAEVLFEDPGHILAREALGAGGARILPASVDEEGLRVDRLPEAGGPAVAFVTPSHQFPLGGCLSIQRRIALVEWARKAGCVIVEDDYESEFRYDVSPVSSIQRLDPQNVVYVGTFSKILFPAIRLGYLVLPRHLAGACVEAKRVTDRYGAPAPQLAMARFIRQGRLDKHIARMRKIYRRRRNALVGGLQSAFGGGVRILGRATGLHVAVSFKGISFDAPLIDRARRAGLLLHPVEGYALRKGFHKNTIAMGYSHLSEKSIASGIAILKGTIGQARRVGHA